jgi:hypothetical protein
MRFVKTVLAGSVREVREGRFVDALQDNADGLLAVVAVGVVLDKEW